MSDFNQMSTQLEEALSVYPTETLVKAYQAGLINKSGLESLLKDRTAEEQDVLDHLPPIIDGDAATPSATTHVDHFDKAELTDYDDCSTDTEYSTDYWTSDESIDSCEELEY